MFISYCFNTYYISCFICNLITFNTFTTTVLNMATLNGAKLQGRDDTGILAVGKKADIAAINLDRPHLYPVIDVPALVTYSAQGSDVCMTMVNGKILYENGEFLTLDADRIFYEARKSVERLYK